MFNNILYFIVVLLLFSISQEEGRPDTPLTTTLGMMTLTWIILAGYCRWGFRRLWNHCRMEGEAEGRVGGEYHRLVFRLSVLSIALFALDIFLFDLKAWLQAVPGFRFLTVLPGVAALSVFLVYLGTIWYFGYPVYRSIFRTGLSLRAFLLSQLKFNVPILFPWVFLTLIYDLLSLISWRGVEVFLNSQGGQILFFAGFLGILAVFMPGLIQYWWECGPFVPSEKLGEIENFLRQKAFSYRSLLRWPIFEGRMLTAGIMGLVPRYRYILVTDALMEALSVEELKAVLAHEMGHAKHHHMIFYLVFLVGYVVLSSGILDLSFQLLAVQPFFGKMLETGEPQGADLFYLALSLPLLASMVVYFRYVMGFFMRHFERQADLFSAVAMGGPRETISSLEKIAFLSGKIRDLPSWHHFSIRERVECLMRFLAEPNLAGRHSRFVARCFALYLIGMVALGYLVHFSEAREFVALHGIERVLEQKATQQPGNTDLHQNLAMIYHKTGKLKEAMGVYEHILRHDADQGVALNNLAWLLLTVPDENLRDPGRALELAGKAVALERSPVFLDTLAEAYHANGRTEEAVRTIEEAISAATENQAYYSDQLRKFKGK
ncbi:MAG: M48 family metalloprotease [Deltaproteobacteria bacterium]|nr:M48 family metalloprotease [Deltaproteobacteria bacterium]